MRKTKPKKVKGIISPYYQDKTMSTKTFTLTLGERLAAIKIFDAFKGNISVLATLLDDVKKFSITTEEWTEAKLVKIPTDEEVAALSDEEKSKTLQTWKWDEEAVNKEITADQSSVDYLTDEIKKKSDAKELTLADVALISLNKKLLA